MIDWAPGPALAAYHSGVTVICELAARFTGEAWAVPTTCPEWRAADLAGHLRCVADDYHEYLDDAPVSRMARLMARGPSAESLARKLARQNAAELAALPDATGPEHIAAFAAAARAYADRALEVWDLPHHRFGDTVVTVGGMVGAACAEWHLHAWDLAASLGKDYQPASPELLAAGWQAGMPHLPLDIRMHVASCGAAVAGAGGAGGAGAGGAANGHPHAGASHEGAWQALLRASGRFPRLSPRLITPAGLPRRPSGPAFVVVAPTITIFVVVAPTMTNA
jgi:Mycothiol maleylpyruvate isomerase N-terminal domain